MRSGEAVRALRWTSIIFFVLLALNNGARKSVSSIDPQPTENRAEAAAPDVIGSAIDDLAFFSSTLDPDVHITRCTRSIAGIDLDTGSRVVGDSSGRAFLGALRTTPNLDVIVGGFGKRFDSWLSFDDPGLSGALETRADDAHISAVPTSSIFIMRHKSESADSWDIATTVIGPDFHHGIEILPNGDTLLVATAGRVGHLQRVPPFRVEKYLLSEMTRVADTPDREATHVLGPVRGAIELPNPAFNMALDRDETHLHILVKSPQAWHSPRELSPLAILSIDVATMTETADPIPLPDWTGFSIELGIPMIALSPDGQHLVTTSGHRPAINIINLKDRTAWVAEIDDADEVTDIAFSHGLQHHGLIALNVRQHVGGRERPPVEGWESSRSQVVIGELRGEGITVLSRGPLHSGRMEGLPSAIEWTPDGSSVVAAVDYKAYTGPASSAALFSIDDSGRRISKALDLYPCAESVFIMDILTLNGHLPTSTPTATATPIPSPTPRSTISPTPTASVTPPPTATLTTETKVYLPTAWRMACLKSPAGIDVGLVIDVSTSMGLPTSAGRTRLEAAQEAALGLASAINLDPLSLTSDRIAIIGFNDTAWVENSLSKSLTETEQAIERLSDHTAEGTRLDLAVREGRTALIDPSRPVSRPVVLVILTDGLPNRVPTPAAGGSQEDTVLAEAEEAKGRGWKVYTIGLGAADAPDPLERINSDLLRRMASSPTAYFETPDAEELRKIFSEISDSVACR